MKRLLLCLLCLLMAGTVICAEGESVDINVQINKADNGYEVVIPADDNYAKLKPTMTVYDTDIKSAYVVKPDGSLTSATVDSKGVTFTVDMSGIYKLVPFISQDEVINTEPIVNVEGGKVEQIESVSKSIADLLGNVDTKVKTTLGNEELSRIVNSTNKVLSQKVVIVPNDINSDLVEKFFQDNKDYSDVSSSDISIFVDYVADGYSGTFMLSELNDTLTFTFKFPEDAKLVADEGKELKYYVLVEHNGELSLIDTRLNDDGTISFDASMFSKYYIVYRQTDIPVNNSESQSSVSQSVIKKPVVNTCAK